jgi:hypothetical protein
MQDDPFPDLGHVFLVSGIGAKRLETVVRTALAGKFASAQLFWLSRLFRAGTQRLARHFDAGMNLATPTKGGKAAVAAAEPPRSKPSITDFDPSMAKTLWKYPAHMLSKGNSATRTLNPDDEGILL